MARRLSGFIFVAALFLTGTSSEVIAAQQRRPGMVRSHERVEPQPERPPVRFADLQRLLRPGQSVVVTDESGKDTQGTVSDITTSSLTLLGPGGQTFGEAAVTKVTVRDGVWNGVLIGLGVGAAIAALACRGSDSGRYVTMACTVPLLGGPALGGVTDWFAQTSYEFLPQHTAVRVSPLLGTERHGVLVSIGF